MLLIADGKQLTKGTKEHCMYESNSMTFQERKNYKYISINYDDNTIALILRQNGKEQLAHLNDIRV